MEKSQKIMKKKAFIRAEMDRTLPEELSSRLWTESADRLADILNRYSSLPKGVRFHTDNYIFPAAAIYLTIRDAAGQETAYSIIENAAVNNTEPMGRKMSKLMKVPGMSSLFIRVWDPLTRKMFGSESGFRNVYYPKKKNEYRMDITACPYCRYFTELGCPELTKIYCDNDERIYGNLPGVKFERTGTLGKGAARCDFFIRKI